MGTENIIVREYLESLKEDGELDKIFPLLLNLMGFRIIYTPKESKGQSQYGKDIIATKKDKDNIQKRYFFELKGYSDKDIDDTTFSKADGIRDSLLASKYAPFSDRSIPGFNDLPIVIVLVHNGLLKSNTRPTFDGFVQKEFAPGGFERWDIHELTDLFSKYLFGEYLLTDPTSLSLFKKVLVLIEAPDYDLKDFRELMIKILNDDIKVKTRRFSKLFATLNLLSYIIFQYCKNANNLTPARNGISFVILQTWAWILKNKIESKKPVLDQFKKLLRIQYLILNDYFQKTIPAAILPDGLCAENGGPFEAVGYPLRAMDYISYLVYYCQLRLQWPKFDHQVNLAKKKRIEGFHKNLLFKIIEQNDGCSRPLIDCHSITILLVALYTLQCEILSKQDEISLHNYVVSIIDNIALIHSQRKRLPELNNNVQSLIEFVATDERPFDYTDSSSMLLMILFELLVITKNDELYSDARTRFSSIVNLQAAYLNLADASLDIEQLMFEGNMNEYMYVESSIELSESFDDFKAYIKKNTSKTSDDRTDKAGFKFLKTLSCIYYQNDIFPNDWRKYIIR